MSHSRDLRVNDAGFNEQILQLLQNDKGEESYGK